MQCFLVLKNDLFAPKRNIVFEFDFLGVLANRKQGVTMTVKSRSLMRILTLDQAGDHENLPLVTKSPT